ncbi:Piezo non-specific cation channel protein [Chloropicon primus]|nr:Piezo non-specific cation channel protein [Chloropicon primus]
MELELVMEFGSALGLAGMAWWRRSAFGVLYALAAVAYVVRCSSTRGKVQACLRYKHRRFASARDKQLATSRAYEFERRKSSGEATIWRFVTAVTWLDLALQSATQLVAQIGGGKVLAGRAEQVLQGLGFEVLHALGFLYVYGAVLLVLMPLAYYKYYSAAQREGAQSPAAPVTVADCIRAHTLVQRAFLLSSVANALVWPSLFGLVYLGVAGTYFVGKFSYRWSRWCREIMDRGLLLAVAPVCLVQISLLYGVQIECDGSGEASCFMGVFGRSWTRFLGLFFAYSRSSSLEVSLFEALEVALVTLHALLLLCLVCPPSWSLHAENRSPRSVRSIASLSSTASLDESAGYSPELQEPLLLQSRGYESMREESSRLGKEFWDFGAEIEFSESFLAFWMYFVNTCACCLIIVSSSLLTNLLLLFALVNIFLIQHDRLHIFWTGGMGQALCSLILLASYLGDVFVCSERGALPFVGLYCSKRPSYKTLLAAAELVLILLYSTFAYVAKNTVRETSNGVVFGSQGKRDEAKVLSGKSSLWDETNFALRLVCFGVLLGLHLSVSIWISVHRINVMSFVFSVGLWGHLTLKGYQWHLVCQKFSMLYLVALTLCDNAMLLFEFQGTAKIVLTNLGLISSNSFQDVFPIVSLIFLNLLLQHASVWYKEIQSEEQVKDLKLWKLGVFCMEWVSRIIKYILAACLLAGICILTGQAVGACGSHRAYAFDILGFGYLVIAALHFVYDMEKRASRRFGVAYKVLGILDYTLQILSYSQFFGLDLGGKISPGVMASVGCVDPLSKRCCFLLYVARPLAVALLLKLQKFSENISERYPRERPAEPAPAMSFCQRLTVRHGDKLVAVCTLAVNCRVGGLFGLALVWTLLAHGISTGAAKGYKAARSIQLLCILVLLLQYACHIKLIADQTGGIVQYLAWIGLWGRKQSVAMTCTVITAAVMSCHLQILSKKWGLGLVSEDGCEIAPCPLFAFGGTRPYGGPGRTPLRKHVSDPHSYSMQASPEIEIAGLPTILPRYAVSPSSELHRSSSCPKEFDAAVELQQTDSSFIRYHFMNEEALSEGGSEKELPSEKRHEAFPLTSKGQQQLHCLIAYLKYTMEYVPLRGILLGVLMLGSAIVSESFLSLFFLLEVAFLLYLTEEKVQTRGCRRVLWYFDSINTALLVYACLVRVILESPWVRAPPCTSHDEMNAWLGFCSDIEMTWVTFFCAWLMREYRRSCSVKNARKNEVKAQLLYQMNSLFFSAEPRRTGIESVLRFLLFHSLDFSMFCIAWISLVNIDVLHLGYFGLSLLYMRCRMGFWQGRAKRLWWIIVIYNFCAISMIVAYQMPWESLVKVAGPESSCSARHVLGVYRISNFWQQAFRVQNGGLMLDVTIFFIVGTQHSILHTKAFHSLVVAFQREKEKKGRSIEENFFARKEAQVDIALKARKHLKARKQRVEWLKRGLLNSKRGSVDVKLGNDKYFSNIKTPGEHLSDSMEESPLLSHGSIEPLNPFTCESPKFALLSEGLQTVSTTGKRLHQLLERLKAAAVQRIQNIYTTRQRDTDSFIVYLLLMFTFVYEFSVVSLVFPLVLFTYALVSPARKPLQFWNLIFYYVEIVLSLRYCFWIPFCHDCPGFSVSSYMGMRQSKNEWWLLLMGIQPKPFPHSIPFMVLYLSIVWHHERVVQRSRVSRGFVEQFHVGHARSVKEKLNRYYWKVHNFFAEICHRSEHAARMPFIIHVSLRRLENGRPWSERSLDEAIEQVYHLYNSRKDSRLRERVPDLYSRLERVDASFIVKSIDAVLDESTDGSVELYDVAIIEISRIMISGHRNLLRPVSDIAEMLKRASDLTQEDFSQGQEASEIEPERRDFVITDSEAVAGEEYDFYVLTLCADIICFVFAIVFYQACMSSREKSFATAFSLKSVFPADYIYALILLFMLIVVDRAIYVLRSNFWKVVYHFGTLGCLLVYLMAKFWCEDTRLSSKASTKQFELQFFFALKAVSLLFSSRQIQAGFPMNTMGHWLLRRRSIFNQALHLVYTNIPFLPELRMMLDWTCTKTTLEFFDWLRVEEIRHSLFRVEMRNMFRQKGIGLKQPWYTKLFQGFLGFCVLSLIIWGPLILYSSSNPAIVTPALTGVSVNLTLTHGTGTFPLFFGGQDRIVERWSQKPHYFGKNFRDGQIKEVVLSPYSDTFWTVSPPRRREIQQTLRNATDDVNLRIDFLFRKSFPVTAQECSLSVSKQLTQASLSGLRKVLDGNASSVPLSFRARSGRGQASFYNLFVQLGGNVQVCEANNRFQPSAQTAHPFAVNCSLGLGKLPDCTQGACEWWELFCDQSGRREERNDRGEGGDRFSKPGSWRGPRVVLVLDKTIGDSVMSSLFASRGGLIGLYVSFVLVIGRLIHTSFSSGLRQRIWVDELPTTGKLKSILDDLDAARAERELAVEEELYWGLVRIYRSPAVLFELTKKRL